jgi:hypothetical protein
VAHVDRADLVALVLELAELIEVRAFPIAPVRLGAPLVVRSVPDATGWVDMTYELSAEALATLVEVLRATEAVR